MDHWTEIAPLTYRCGAVTHLCGEACDRPTVRVGGSECCDVSGLRMGHVIAFGMVAEDMDDAPVAAPAKRARMKDPLDVDGALQQQRAAETIYRKLFVDALLEKGSAGEAALHRRQREVRCRTYLANAQAGAPVGKDAPRGAVRGRGGGDLPQGPPGLFDPRRPARDDGHGAAARAPRRRGL